MSAPSSHQRFHDASVGACARRVARGRQLPGHQPHPRRLATQFMGWFGKTHQSAGPRPFARRSGACSPTSISTKPRRSSSRACTTASSVSSSPARARSTPIPDVLVSPCDAIVGACGAIDGDPLYQAKGFPYTLNDLLDDPELVSLYRDGRYVTLRLTSSMYHRFHAPHDCRVEQVTYVSGDTWNTNPITVNRVEKLFCKNERAVLRTRLARTGQLVTLVPVASILVASIRLHFLDVLLHLRYRGPQRDPLRRAAFARARRWAGSSWDRRSSSSRPPESRSRTTYSRGRRSRWGSRCCGCPDRFSNGCLPGHRADAGERRPRRDAGAGDARRHRRRNLRLQRDQVLAEHLMARRAASAARCWRASSRASNRCARRHASSRSSSIAPLTPSLIRSTGPGAGTDATGRPDAIASSRTLPKVSVRDGNTKQSALAKCAARSSP